MIQDQISFVDSHCKLRPVPDLVLPYDCKKDGYLVFCLLYQCNSIVWHLQGVVHRKEQKKLPRAFQLIASAQCHDWWSAAGEPSRYQSRWLVLDIMSSNFMDIAYLQDTQCGVEVSIRFVSWRIDMAVTTYENGTHASRQSMSHVYSQRFQKRVPTNQPFALCWTKYSCPFWKSQ